MALGAVGRKGGERGELTSPVDHPASLSEPNPWRTTAIVAAAVAALELLLLVILALLLVAKPFLGGDEVKANAGKRSSPATRKAAALAPRLSRAETSVLVLNGNGRPGAAGETADLLRTRRYVIAGTGNAPRTDFARSLVMFRAGYRAEAVRLARDFRITRVAPLDGLRPADLQGAHVALVVGAE